MKVVDPEEVFGRVTYTPAERAVLVEQSETIKLHLTKFMALARGGEGAPLTHAYLDLARHMDYVSNLVTTKMQHTAALIEAEKR